MADNITKKDYITITDSKVMVGGKETTTYHGQQIWMSGILPSYFKNIQQIVKDEYGAAPIEMHVLSSGTSGRYAKPGTPSVKPGKNAWVQFVFANGTKTPWVLYDPYSSASGGAGNCALNCGYVVRAYSDFRVGVFGAVADAIKPVVQVKPKVVNRSGDVTTMEIDFGKQKLQFQINARSLLKSNGK
jgi:hypothetical protein